MKDAHSRASNFVVLIMHCRQAMFPTSTSKLSVCPQAGEELLIDYGPDYWKTRQEQVID